MEKKMEEESKNVLSTPVKLNIPTMFNDTKPSYKCGRYQPYINSRYHNLSDYLKSLPESQPLDLSMRSPIFQRQIPFMELLDYEFWMKYSNFGKLPPTLSEFFCDSETQTEPLNLSIKSLENGQNALSNVLKNWEKTRISPEVKKAAQLALRPVTPLRPKILAQLKLNAIRGKRIVIPD